MTLILHSGAVDTDYTNLRHLETPPATASHVPIPHFRLVDMLRHTLGFYGHEITAEHHGITEDGNRYFGVLSLKSTYTGYEDTLGLRNSHDKSFPVGISYGARVFVCDNLSFMGEHVIKRKHTANLKRDLPGLVSELIEPLTEQREKQALTIERYRSTRLSDRLVNHAIMSMYRDEVISVTKIADVLDEYEEPSFEEFKDGRTAWRLFNAATFVLTGKVTENPGTTTKLHQIIDGVSERAN